MLLESLVCALALQLPGPTVALSGTVRDASTGEPLAVVELVLADAGLRTLSDASGRYRFTGVPPGPQHLTAARLGYTSRTLHALVPGSGGIELDIALQPQPLRLRVLEAVLATSLPARDPGPAAHLVDRNLSGETIRGHPLLAEADAFLALTGGSVVAEAEAPAGLNVRGGAADQTGYLIDGVPVLSPYHAAGLFGAFNPDALARVSLSATVPPLAAPDVLSGTVAAETRAPGHRMQARGAASNTQSRIVIDGPVGERAGYLLSVRSSFPAGAWRHDEASYVRPEHGDLLATVRVTVLGGEARLLWYDAENELSASAGTTGSPVSGAEAAEQRNEYGWRSRSAGAQWRRASASDALQVQAWWAAQDASADWWAAPSSSRLLSKRADAAITTSYTRRTPGAITGLGARLHRIRTRYTAGAAASGLRADGALLAGSVSAEHTRSLSGALNVVAGGSLTYAGDVVRLLPRALLELRAASGFGATLAYSRTQQLAQSLRNPESLAGRVFPADLHVVAGEAGVPVAHGDQLVATGSWQATPGARLVVEAFARRLDDVVMVPLREAEPFALGAPAVGRGRAAGTAVEVEWSGAHHRLLLDYGWQQVRLEHADSAYRPAHGTAHLLGAGLAIYPGATTLLRAAVNAAAGRRATGMTGALEWETCNLLDQGCEFAGSPRLEGEPGGAALPAYLRLDLGARKHWHVRVGGREAQVAVFGTVSNVLGRSNVLARVRDPVTGRQEAVELLPRAPLVVGLDWRF